MQNFSRNQSEGLAQRTLKNFLFIEGAFKRGEDVHVVTQAVCSLLALVVFPWGKAVFDDAKKARLSDLNGWPKWEIVSGHCETLYDLLKNLRHGIAHSHVWFDSESRFLHEVSIEVENPHRNFKAQIKGDDLREFCIRISKRIENVVG